MTAEKSKSKSQDITNYMEVLADEVLRELLPQYKETKFSNGAIQDIKALALNRLWPMYTTTTQGRSFVQRIVEEDNVTKDVLRELRAAIDIVTSNPRG